MRLIINGTPREIPDESSVAELISYLELGEGKGVAVAVDGDVVRRREWVSTRLSANQRVEVLRAVQGG